MKPIALISATLILLWGCTTQKRCQSKFPPSVSVTDSIFVKDTVWVEKDTIVFAADSVVVIDSVWCKGDAVVIERLSSVPGVRSSVSSSLNDNKLRTVCKADSLSHIVDGLRRELREIRRERSEVKTVEVIEYKDRRYIPKWVWYLLAINFIQIAWRTRRIWLRI